MPLLNATFDQNYRPRFLGVKSLADTDTKISNRDHRDFDTYRNPYILLMKHNIMESQKGQQRIIPIPRILHIRRSQRPLKSMAVHLHGMHLKKASFWYFCRFFLRHWYMLGQKFFYIWILHIKENCRNILHTLNLKIHRKFDKFKVDFCVKKPKCSLRFYIQ